MDYDSFSTIYDLTCPGVDGDVKFYIQRAKQIEGKVLEIGCGTGRIYLSLLKSGIKVVGIDSSKEMLSLLQKKAEIEDLKPDVYLQSMIHLENDQKFELIFLPYRTFMHLYEQKDQIMALKKMKDALLPHGEIVIDLFNPDLSRIALKSSYFLLDSSPKNLVWLWEEFDAKKQLVKNIFRVESLDTDGTVVKTVVKDFKAKWFYPKEFESLIQIAGLKVKDIYSDYFGNKFTGCEDKMIWVLEKNNES